MDTSTRPLTVAAATCSIVSMALPLKESNAARALAACLSDFLPGSGAREWTGHITFASVATSAGVAEFWAPTGSKTPRLAYLLEATLEHRRASFERLIVSIVRQGLSYRRGRGRPVTSEEIDVINGLILEIGFRFPDLWEPGFRSALSSDDKSRAQRNVAQVHRDDEVRVTAHQEHLRTRDQLHDDFLALHGEADRQAAGLKFEALLNRLFQLSALAPREPFRVTGEQIDGSFELDHDVYLLEVKWERAPVGQAALLAFKGKVEAKSAFTRGVFIAVNGISEPARDAITRGKQPTFFAMDGFDLVMILRGSIDLIEFLRRRRRLLLEEGLVVAPFDRVGENR